MKISEAINKTAMNQLEVLKEEYAVAENEVTLLQQSYDRLKAEGADDAVLKQYKDQLKSQQESLAEIGSELASALESTLSNIVEQLSDEFENALYLAEEELFKVIDLDTAKTFYDEYADLADNFLDSVEKTYELDTLMRKINSSMVDSKNLTGQKKLVDLAAEVADYQSSSAKMSQYEVDLLQAKYDLTLAQIALEESQNAKTQMRLTRDNSGNYSYVYTADQSAIDDAQQDVADKEKALYDLSKSYESEISEMWLELLSQYEEDQQQLFQKYQEGLITYDDYIDKKAEIDDIYYEKLDYLYGELNKVYKNSTLTFDNSVLQLATGANTLTELFDDSCTFINNVSDEATEKAEKNADLIEQALGSVGLSSLELSNTFDSAADSIISAGDDLKTSTVTSLEEMNAALQENLNEVENWARQVSAAFQEVASIRESTLTSTESSVSAPDYSILYMESIQSGDTTTAKAALKARAAKIAAGADDYGVTNSALSAWGSAYTNSSSSMNSAAQSLVTDSGTLAERLEKYGFDTGGYTGDWGSDGRLALLHQKELVLNQEDTQNILDAVSLIRSMNDVIMSSINGDALATSYALSKMANAETAETTKDTIVQQVMIEANFEGATDAIEIKNALQGLINDAAQYAGQKNF
jgi:hypothetical protein